MNWASLNLGFLCLAMLMTAAAAGEERRVEATFVADARAIDAGQPFLLGVELVPEPGWHVYWRNPGEAGLATEIVYRLPDGFSVGELRWPTPVEFEQPGGLVGYGYEERVVLAAEVTPARGVTGSIPVVVEASWLACKDVCVLESATLSADLPLEGAALDASAAAFESWRSSLPSTDGAETFDHSVSGGPVPGTGAAELVVWLSWKAAPGAVEFFPDPGAGLKVEGVRVQTRGNLTRIDATVSRLKTTDAEEATLSALIVTRDSEGIRRATVSHITID